MGVEALRNFTLSKNPLPAADVPALISSVHAAIVGLGAPAAVVDAFEKPGPADIRRSVTADALISFIDNRPYKSLKRHLRSHGLDPAGYRQRYSLPADYPMVCAAYSAARSDLAKSMGLGRKPDAPVAQAA